MNRRRILKAARSFILAPLAAPAIAAPAKTLRFVPQGNLNHPDPLVTIAPVARNAGHMIWDQLYGQTLTGQPVPQMLAGHALSSDGRTWRFTLREELRFHDGVPVRAQDCVASLLRWSKRRAIGLKIAAETDVTRVLDDRRFEIVTKRPFPLLPAMLARDTFFFVMPERMANTPPLQQISEFVGSGPYRFVSDEWVSGVRAVFSRADTYTPRNEPPDFLAGGKRALFDRIEWAVLPDPATASAALQRGEVDWLQRPHTDSLPILRKSPGVVVNTVDPFGSMLAFLINHQQPPFNNPALRRALLPAIDQATYMQGAIGDDTAIARPGIGFFTPGLGMDSTAGLEALTGKRDISLARRLIAESGYRNEKIVILAATEVPEQSAISQITADLFGRLGLNVDLVTMDQGVLEKRRLSREPVEKGGWSIAPLTFDGLSAADPSSHQILRGIGTAGFFGWPDIPELEAQRNRWFDAPDRDAQQAICREMQRTAFDAVPFMPLGHWFAPTALRANLTAPVRAPFPIFWGIDRS